MSYDSNLPADVNVVVSTADIRENLRALKEDKIVDAATAVSAESAAKLATPRTLGLQGDATGSASFDGSADVAITVDVLNADTAAQCAGNAATATKLESAREISLAGDATGSTIFDGSADVAITVDVLNADTSAQCTGNAATASKLVTARNINGVAFDGTKDITIKAEANGGNSDTVGGETVADIISACAIYAVPAGAVEYFARTSAPEGWLKADGSAVSRTSYAKLFSAIGTMFGAGNGSTTFNLPDLRGEFIRGFDGGRGVDAGRTLGSNQADNFKSHNHRFINEYDAPTTKIVAFTDESSENVTAGIVPGERAWTYISMENTGGLETRPRNVSLLACIKY